MDGMNLGGDDARARTQMLLNDNAQARRTCATA